MVATVKSEATTIAPIVTEGMLATVPQKALANVLALMSKVCDPKSTLAILGHVAIKVHEGTTICATDLNLTLTMRAPAWDGTRGDFTVPCKQLTEIVKSAPSSEVTLARTGSGLRVASGDADTTLLGIPARDFPKLPSSEGLAFNAIDGSEFATLIERVLPSVCQDETRFQLNGVYLETEDFYLRAVSTDGHRLTLAQARIAETFRTGGAIVPAKAAREIVRLIKSERGATCSVAVKAPHLFVRVGAYELAAKMIDAQFPPYWQVVPQDHKKLVTVARKPLVAALKRAKPMCKEGVRDVKFAVNGTGDKLTLSCDHPDLGSMSEGMAVETACGAFTIGFNPRYMLDALGEIEGERVTLAFGGELDPVLVRDTDTATSAPIKQSDYLGVIMPMRV